MSANLEELQNWFVSGTAEEERKVLEKAFVYVSELKRILNPRPNNLYLLIGRKGSGKSALIEFAHKLLTNQKVPALILRPRDLETAELGENRSTADLIQKFYPVVLNAIAGKLAEVEVGYLNQEEAIIYNQAIQTGHKSPEFFTRLARLLPRIARPVIKLDFTTVLSELTQHTKSQLEHAISSKISERSFYLFFDDTDQVANPDKADHLNRIWGVLLAIRHLAQEIPELKAIITLRSEIWQRLSTEPSSQRDQTDHFENLIIHLSSSDQHVQEIVETRLQLAAECCHLPGTTNIYGPFFEGETARAPKSSEYRSWRDLIVVRCRQRPRDAVQLIFKLSDYALNKRKASKIDEHTFQSVMPEFSMSRATLFANEFKDECPEAFQILKSFSRAPYEHGGFRLTADQAKVHLRTLPDQFGIHLYGQTIHSGNEDDLFALWRFLFIASVLNARISDSTQKDGYRHLNADENPQVVSKNNWNEMQRMLWEINPAFRDFLIEDQKTYLGMERLPTKIKRKTRNRF